MDEDLPVAGLPLLPYRAGSAAGGLVAVLVALVVVLGIGIDPLRVLMLLGVFVVILGVSTVLRRLFGNRSVIPDAGVPRAVQPQEADPRGAFWRGVWIGFGIEGVVGVALGLLAWLFDDWSMLDIAPGVMLFGPAEVAREVPALRRWEAAHDVRLYTRRGARRQRMAGLRVPDGLVAVPREVAGLADPADRP